MVAGREDVAGGDPVNRYEEEGRKLAAKMREAGFYDQARDVEIAVKGLPNVFKTTGLKVLEDKGEYHIELDPHSDNQKTISTTDALELGQWLVRTTGGFS